MSTTTATLGLTLPTETEPYDINIVNTNNTAIDNAIGVLVSELSGNGGIGGKVDAIQADVTETKATVNTIQATTETIQTQAEQNGTDIAAVKTVADSNATKLDTANSAITTANSALTRLEADADSISGKVTTVETKVVAVGESATAANTNASGAKTVAEANGVKLDTVLTRLGTMQTALDNANTNISTLLSQSKGVKAITTGTTTANSEETATASIPSTMNPAKVVIIASSFSGASVNDSGIIWTMSGRTVTFKTKNNATVTYQFIEFY